MGNDSNQLTTSDKSKEIRIWKILDKILDRLESIENKVIDLVRVEERVDSHTQMLRRYNDLIDKHDGRIRNSELWQANQGDKETIQRQIVVVQSEVKDLEIKVTKIINTHNINKGSRDTEKSILKWVIGFLTAVLIFITTNKLKGN